MTVSVHTPERASFEASSTKAGLPVGFVIEIDGSLYSGSGTIVRQTVTFAAVTAQPVHVVNARVRRPKPGLRHQHVMVVEAIREIVGGRTEGVQEGSQEFTLWPGGVRETKRYTWDIGSAGSTTLLALAVLPVFLFAPNPVEAELHGGIFQDFAPSFYHLQQVMLPLLRRLGVDATIAMVRPGYVPAGGGILHVKAAPARNPLRPVVQDRPLPLEGLSGIALASHLKDRQVAGRMAQAAQETLRVAGYESTIELQDDTTALQRGAALALFAHLTGGWRLGADWAGAPGRPSEVIGSRVAKQLLEDLRSNAILDRFAADQIIPFAALADGESRFRIPEVTDHIASNAWLAKTFLEAEVQTNRQILSIRGAGLRPFATSEG